MHLVGRLALSATILAVAGCGGLGMGRKSASPGFAPIGEPDVHPFQQPFPNLQAARKPIDLPAPAGQEAIALTSYRAEGEIIDLPLPGQSVDAVVPAQDIIVEAPMPGEGCADGACAAPEAGCSNGMCSTDGLALHGQPGCAPEPTQYAHGSKHAGLAAEREQMRGMGIKPRRRWYQSWKADPNPDIAYNNPCFPRELRMASHPQYLIEPPDVLYIEAITILPSRPLLGERLVRQDGTISLGYYGQVHVAGLTILEVETKIRKHMERYVENPQVYVDVASFNSKVYYVLGQVQQQGRLPITGKETVLDAITLAGGITNFAAVDKIHVARPNPGGGCDQVLWVDWKSLAYCGDTRTNYQLMPGDRVVVPSTNGFKTNVIFDNYLSPVERLGAIFGLFRFALSNN
jgi:polysaccharide export outer membrane protein